MVEGSTRLRYWQSSRGSRPALPIRVTKNTSSRVKRVCYVNQSNHWRLPLTTWPEHWIFNFRSPALLPYQKPLSVHSLSLSLFRSFHPHLQRRVSSTPLQKVSAFCIFFILYGVKRKQMIKHNHFSRGNLPRITQLKRNGLQKKEKPYGNIEYD